MALHVALGINRCLDDSMEELRAVQDTGKVHDFPDTSYPPAPSTEGFGGFLVTYAAAGRFDGTGRRCGRDGGVDSLGAAVALFNEVFNSRESIGGIRDFVGTLEVGGQPHRQGNFSMTGRAEAAAFTVVVRIHQPGCEEQSLGIHDPGRGSDTSRDVSHRRNAIAGNGERHFGQQFGGRGIE